MRLTTKGRYAVTAMIDLALHGEHSPVTLTDISERQYISLSYLEQIFARLRRAGLVIGIRGPGGGYRLSRETGDINIAQIITAVDEVIDPSKCGGKANCQDDQVCLAHSLWVGLSHHIRQYLEEVSLRSLIERKEVKKTAARQDKQADQVARLDLYMKM